LYQRQKVEIGYVDVMILSEITSNPESSYAARKCKLCTIENSKIAVED
jgi:hypothetical protein